MLPSPPCSQERFIPRPPHGERSLVFTTLQIRFNGGKSKCGLNNEWLSPVLEETQSLQALFAALLSPFILEGTVLVAEMVNCCRR